MIRIAYIIDGLHNSGGMERVLSIKANYLSNLTNYDITIITINHDIGKEPFFSLNENIKHINLEISGNCSISKKANKKLIIKQIKETLTTHLMNNKYDICISMGGKEMKYLPLIKDGSKKILEFHFGLTSILHSHRGSSFSFLSKALRLWKMRRIIKVAAKYDKIIVLTKDDKKLWQRLGTQVSQIYNPIIPKEYQTSTKENKIAISIGRLSFQKGFDYLIKSWKNVAKKHPEWVLHIYGEGEERLNLENLITSLNLDKNVFLMGVTKNLEKQYHDSSFMVCSSRYEGFPMVITEALSYGLPIVSYSSPFGPSELIDNKINGFLIPGVGNISKLSNSIISIIEDNELRKQMSLASLEKSKEFNIEKVMKQWTNLFVNILNS